MKRFFLTAEAHKYDKIPFTLPGGAAFNSSRFPGGKDYYVVVREMGESSEWFLKEGTTKRRAYQIVRWINREDLKK